jgi:uncharacterized membrane protein YhaH (DUF805 family)
MLGWLLLIAWLACCWLFLVFGPYMHHGKFWTNFGLSTLGPYIGLQLADGDPAVKSASIHFGVKQLLNLFDSGSYRWPSRDDIVPLLVNLTVTPLLVWTYLAISIKRLHDRNRSGWWIVPLAVLPCLYEHYEAAIPESYWFAPLGLASLVLSIWGFIELACLKGDASSNRFGPNPLGKQHIRPRSTEMRLRTTTAWDQESEIELAPHRASPLTSMHVKRRA